jgi:small-conductance mechanosensitive channel
MLADWGVIAVVAVGAWVGGWLLVRLLDGVAGRIARRTRTQIDDVLIASVRPHVPFWLALAGVVIAARVIEMPAATLAWLQPTVESLFILSVSLVVSRFLAAIISEQLARRPELFPATTLTLNVVRAAVIVLGLLVIASNLGIAVTPILTALGVGSLAVALALQPTLANLFAGFHVTLARQIRVGDFIELDDGKQGFVTDIGWRATQIRETANNVIVVPNAKLAEMVVKNYSLPESEQAALIQVGVSYDSDLDHVERVTVEVARQALREVEGGVPEFEPFIRLHTFGNSSIDFTVILRVRQFTDRHLVAHEFIKRLHRRYAEEGIEIPFPQRVVSFAGGATGRVQSEPQPERGAGS